MDVLKPAFEYDYNTGDYGTLKNLNAIWSAVQTPFSLLDASGNAALSIAYMDASLAARDAKLAILNTSTGVITSRHNFSETSIGVLTSRLNFTDTSLNILRSRHNFTETSLYVNFNANASLGLAFNVAANASLGYTSQLTLVENTSIGVLTSRHNITETSLGSAIRYRSDLTLVGLKNASGNTLDMFVKDASAYFKVAATSWMVFGASIYNFG